MTNFEMLCTAVNAREEYALEALADYLEEQSDARAEGLRQVIREGKVPYHHEEGGMKGFHTWHEPTIEDRYEKSRVPHEVFDRLNNENTSSAYHAYYRDYPTATDAYLDLARVYSEMAEEERKQKAEATA